MGDFSTHGGEVGYKAEVRVFPVTDQRRNPFVSLRIKGGEDGDHMTIFLQTLREIELLALAILDALGAAKRGAATAPEAIALPATADGQI